MSGDDRSARLARLLFRYYPDDRSGRYAEEAWRTFLDLRREQRARGRHAVAWLWLRVVGSTLVRGTAERFRGVRLSLPPTLRAAARTVIRRPAFSLVVILILGLGIGANAAVFSVVNAVLVESIPFAGSERLVLIEGHLAADATKTMPMSYLDIRDLAAASTTLERVAARTLARSLNITSGEQPEHVEGEMVGHAYFDVLGVEPVLGRMFAAEHETPGIQQFAVLGYDLWQRRFAAQRDVVGGAIEVDGRNYEILGVAPAGFRGLSDSAELWLPIPMAAAIYGNFYLEARAFRWLAAVGVRAEGATMSQVNAELARATDALAGEFGQTNDAYRAHATALADTYFGDLSRNVLLLWAAAGFVLLVACANVASLLLTDTLARRGEIAVRRALGAQRGRLVREHLAEAMVLSLCAAAVGLGVAAAVGGLLTKMLAHALPSFVEIHIDARVVMVMFGMAMLTAGVAAGAPAWALVRTGNATPGHGARSTRSGFGRLDAHSVLLTLEVALAVALCVGATLTVKGFQNLLQTDLGLRLDGVMTARLDVQDERFDELAAYQGLIEELIDGTTALAGVEGAALIGPKMPTDDWNGLTVSVEERMLAGLDEAGIDLIAHRVSPGYFGVLGVPVLRGRDFERADRSGAGAPFVAAVSRTTAERLWPGDDALGKRMKLGGPQSNAPWMEIVAVVADVEYAGLGPAAPLDMDVYLPLLQLPARTPPVLNLMVRTDLTRDTILPRLTEVARRAAPASPLFDVRPLAARVGDQASPRRAIAALMGVFATLALVLAAAGVYAVIAHAVTRQRRQIGIRMALGARAEQLFRFVLARALVLGALGVVLGVLGSIAGTRAIDAWLFGVSATDPWSYALAAGLVLSATAAAAWLPARRAARVDPMVSLESDA